MNYEIIAHRGFSAIAPENTLAAFREAMAHQANSIEFDVQLSSDSVPIIIHDTTVDRTTNGIGWVRDKTLEELKALDAGSWFSSHFAGETILTFREALRTIQTLERETLTSLQHLYAEVSAEGIDIVDWTVDTHEDFHKLTTIGILRIVTNSLVNVP